MNILFITDLYPISTNEIKTPKTLFSFVKEWQKLGHHVEVIKPNFLLNSYLRNKPFYKTGQYGNVFNVNYFTPFLFDVKNKLPKFEYDVIVAHMPSGVIFSNHFDGKIICAVHNSDLEVLTNPLYKFYFKSQLEKAYKKSVGIACRSKVIKEKFLKLYPEFEQKVFCCESGIDFEPTLKTSSQKKSIVTCANLIKRKNVDKLIQAVNELSEFDLTVIGNGSELNKLKKIAQDNVKFVGQKDNKEVLDLMRQSDIFVLPSVNETFGMVYLEAMANGCITVCTKQDGVDGIIIDGENGFLTEPTVSSIKSTLQKIKNLSEEETEILLKKCYNTAKTYNLTDCAELYIKNILKII